MKVFATALCLSLLVVSCQTAPSNPLANTCSQLCQQTCNITKQVFSVFAIFLGPFVNTGHALCIQGCGLACGIFG